MTQPKKQISSSAIRSTSQLARELGLSRWTVSRVINGHPGIHPETAERVRAAMEKHRFSPNPLARGLRRGRTNLIGICAPDVDDYFLATKLVRLRLSLQQRGFQVMLGLTGDANETPDPEGATLDHFRQLCVAGVVLFASRLTLRHPSLERLREAQIPLVMVDPLTAKHPHSVTIDRAHASREIMAHLFELGHRHFITAGMSNAGLYTRTRLKAICAFLEERGLSPETQLSHLPLLEGRSNYDSGYENAKAAAERLKPHPDRPSATAILAINDRVALGLIAGLRELGLETPRDYSITGYDNMEYAPYMSPRLTSVDPCAAELMEKAAERLLAAMLPDPPRPRALSVKPKLVPRETSAAPPAGTA